MLLKLGQNFQKYFVLVFHYYLGLSVIREHRLNLFLAMNLLSTQLATFQFRDNLRLCNLCASYRMARTDDYNKPDLFRRVKYEEQRHNKFFTVFSSQLLSSTHIHRFFGPSRNYSVYSYIFVLVTDLNIDKAGSEPLISLLDHCTQKRETECSCELVYGVLRA